MEKKPNGRAMLWAKGRKLSCRGCAISGRCMSLADLIVFEEQPPLDQRGKYFSRGKYRICLRMPSEMHLSVTIVGDLKQEVVSLFQPRQCPDRHIMENVFRAKFPT
jgi:hypothetical protein